MTFLSDVAHGKLGERLFSDLLVQAGINVTKVSGRKIQIEWDVQSELYGLQFSVEVKCDFREAKTGNVAIEYYNPKAKKLSGISATTAELWVIVLQAPTTIWVAAVTDVRRYMKQEKCERTILCGGDKNASFKLYNRCKIFQAVFHRIDELAPWELSDLLVKMLGTKHVEQRERRYQEVANSL
jgi:hypothetical protein